MAGNGENLDGAIRRAAPALRETDKVLAKLAKQNQVLADLTRDADQVVGDLAANRKDVGRWVVEARDTAVASAERKPDIALGFQRLPGFLEELKPTMAALGATADAQAPALRSLSRSADQLERLFDDLGPFADANRPALRALARASKTGGEAVRSATPVVQQLATFAKGTPELGGNLAAILEHLDDPAHAVENDPRAARATGRPAPTGYTGLEALLHLRLRPDALDEHLRRERAHPEDRGHPPELQLRPLRGQEALRGVQGGVRHAPGPQPARSELHRPDRSRRRSRRSAAPPTSSAAAAIAHRRPQRPTRPAPATGTAAPTAGAQPPAGAPKLPLPLPVLPSLPKGPSLPGKGLPPVGGIGRQITLGAAGAMARDELQATSRSRAAGTSLLSFLMGR